MSQCNLDHSVEEVKKKFVSQSEFLPDELMELFTQFFKNNHSQENLNEVFHLLKKYDLASDLEKLLRNDKLFKVLK